MSNKMDLGGTQHLSELRILLMSNRGAGKSSTGNTILGREEFGLTQTAQCVKRHGEVADRHITVIEAPGWFMTIPVEDTSEIIKREILLSVSLCPPGPHAILIVVRADYRFKEKERKILQGYIDLLGERVWSHTIVLFTFGDFLLDTSIEQHIESEGQDLQWLVEKCGNRYHVLNNLNRSDDTQIKELLEKIEETVAQNNGRHFEIDRKILQEMKERKRAEKERAEERRKRVKKQRDDIRSQMREICLGQSREFDTWSVQSSAYGSFGARSGASSRSDSPFSSVDSLNLQKRCNSMELPSPYMSGDERSDTMSVRSSVYSLDIAEAEEDSS